MAGPSDQVRHAVQGTPDSPADDLVTYTLNDGAAEAAAEASAAAPADPPPLPFHTIEGVGGGAITPMAYLVNPGAEDAVFGKPAVALTYANLGLKNLTAITVTETLFQRIELGYAADRLGLGTLPGAIHEFTQGAANNYEF